MTFIIKHKKGIVKIQISNRNRDKHIIEGEYIIKRKCGDCNQFLDVNSFDLRSRKGKKSVNTKCAQCHKIRKLIARSFKVYEKDSSTNKILGIEYHKFINWLDNGILKHSDSDVHIDHIIPQSLGRTEEDMKYLNHYTNLQLMTASENLKKSNKYILKQDLEKVLQYSPYSTRLKNLIDESQIEIK